MQHMTLESVGTDKLVIDCEVLETDGSIKFRVTSIDCECGLLGWDEPQIGYFHVDGRISMDKEGNECLVSPCDAFETSHPAIFRCMATSITTEIQFPAYESVQKPEDKIIGTVSDWELQAGIGSTINNQDRLRLSVGCGYPDMRPLVV